MTDNPFLMPLYQYEVILPDGEEGMVFEVMQKMSDPPLTEHPVLKLPSRVLSLERPTRGTQLVGAQQFRDRFTHGDERSWKWYLEERHAICACRVQQWRRDPIVIHSNAESDGRDPGATQACDKISPPRIFGGEGDPGRQDDFAALEVLAEIKKLGGGDPGEFRISWTSLHQTEP